MPCFTRLHSALSNGSRTSSRARGISLTYNLTIEDAIELCSASSPRYSMYLDAKGIGGFFALHIQATKGLESAGLIEGSSSPPQQCRATKRGRATLADPIPMQRGVRPVH